MVGKRDNGQKWKMREVGTTNYRYEFDGWRVNDAKT